MMTIGSMNKYVTKTMDLAKKAILMSSEVVTYKLTKEEMNKEFNKYRNKININKILI